MSRESDWAKNLFVSTAPYNRMVGAIRRQRYEWQYFEGMAFLTDYTQIQYDIAAEAYAAIEELKEEMREGSDLMKRLDEKIKEYEQQEYWLYQRLLGRLKFKTTPTWVLPASGGTVQEKINSWDYLFLAPILTAVNEQDETEGIVLEGEDAIYCFLMSNELYEELKNSPFLRTRLSRHDWEKAYTGETTRYDKGEESEEMKALEEEFYQAFVADRRSSTSIRSAIWNAMDNALSEASLGLDELEKGKYLKIINKSYGDLVSKVKKNPAQNTDYKYIHDELKQWGLETLRDINQRISKTKKKKDGTSPYIERVEVGNNNITFFLIEQTGEAEDDRNLAEGLSSLIFKYFDSFAKAKKPFTLDSLKIGKHTYSYKTANSAADRWNAIRRNTTELAIKRFVASAKGKRLKSNSIISGILGEMAGYFSSRKFNVNAILTGDQEQLYRYGQRRKRDGSSSDRSLMGRIQLSKDASEGLTKYAQSFKSTGQFFSDMQLTDELGELTGINVKRYITNETSFTLTTAQSKGLDLSHRNLRRYLTEKEIILLSYLQSNYAILRDHAEAFPSFPFSIEEVAESIMNNNLTSVLRITSAGFDTTNYIIAANGHFIPASCILQYARQKLEKAIKKGDHSIIYDIYNAAPLSYTTRKITPRTSGGTEDGSNNDAKIDVAKLRYIERIKDAKSLTYRFKNFNVSINQLLKL